MIFGSVGGNAQLLLNIPPDKRGRIHENDARRLKELGDRLRMTFSVNLAAPMGYTLNANSSKTVIERDLVGPKTFNVAMIKEDIRHGQRIEAFALDVWDGQGWKEIAQGSTIGWKKLLRFPAVETTKVRLRILRPGNHPPPLRRQ